MKRLQKKNLKNKEKYNDVTSDLQFRDWIFCKTYGEPDDDYFQSEA